MDKISCGLGMQPADALRCSQRGMGNLRRYGATQRQGRGKMLPHDSGVARMTYLHSILQHLFSPM